MGTGIEAARAEAPEHAALMENMRDQLIIVLMKRLADADGKIAIPVAEIDDTGSDVLSFSVDPAGGGVFCFQLGKKN